MMRELDNRAGVVIEDWQAYSSADSAADMLRVAFRLISANGQMVGAVVPWHNDLLVVARP